MPTFAYTAYNRAGRLIKGEVVADSAALAKGQIVHQGLAPLNIAVARAQGEKWWEREVFTINKNKKVPLALFTRELASFLSAGLRISESLDAIGETSADAVGVFAGDVATRVVEGASLSRALRGADGSVPASYIAMIEAGEASGKLDEVLLVLAEGLEREESFKAKIQGALIYPVILLVAAIGAVLLAVFGVVPKLAPLLDGNTEDLALPAQALLGLAQMRPAGWGILVAVLVLAAAALRLAFARPAARKTLSRLSFALPLVGPLLKARQAAIYCRSLGMMLRHDVGVVDAMRIAAKTLDKSPATTPLLEAAEQVRKGEPLTQVIASVGILPISAIRLMSSGDRAGRLADMTLNAAIRLETEVEQRAEKLATILPTIMTLLMGILVAVIIASVFSVILSVNEVGI